MCPREGHSCPPHGHAQATVKSVHFAAARCADERPEPVSPNRRSLRLDSGTDTIPPPRLR
eukprot:6709655-Prymnesium_polylepis.1